MRVLPSTVRLFYALFGCFFAFSVRFPCVFPCSFFFASESVCSLQKANRVFGMEYKLFLLVFFGWRMLFGFFLLFFFRYISLFRFFFFFIFPFSIYFLHLFTCPVLLNCPPELNRSTERCPLNVPVYVFMAQRNMPLRMVMMSELMGIVRQSRSLCCAKLLS